jgi:hypothetical protein
MLLLCHLLLFQAKLRLPRNSEKQLDKQLYDQKNLRFAIKMGLQVNLPVSVLHLQRAAQEHGTPATTVVRVVVKM